jgi:hypothetical protein
MTNSLCPAQRVQGQSEELPLCGGDLSAQPSTGAPVPERLTFVGQIADTRNDKSCLYIPNKT